MGFVTPRVSRCCHGHDIAVAAFRSRRLLDTQRIRPLSFSGLSPFVSPKTALFSTALSTPAMRTLAASSLAGTLADRFTLFPGTIVSLLVAASLSNLGLAPVKHPLYDVCWTKLLPASLALLIMSGLPSQNSANGASVSQNDDGSSSRETVMAVIFPFVIGAVGSIIGCLLSFAMSLILAHSKLKRWSIPPMEAAVASGSLCSSYIGGTVNLFSTARALGRTRTHGVIDFESLLGSMAAADLLVMALYFAGMSGLVKSKFMRKLFPGRGATGAKTNDSEKGGLFADHTGESNERRLYSGRGVDCGDSPKTSTTLANRAKQLLRRTSAAGFSLALAWRIVGLSDHFEVIMTKTLGIPGMGCAAITVLGAIVGRTICQIELFANGSRGAATFPPPWFFTELDAMCPRLTSLIFNLLFAAIGTSANIKVALRHGPASLIFALLALLVHVLVILFGSWGAMKAAPNLAFFPLSIEEVMVASNAAIGGPATAAAFAGSVSKKRMAPRKRRDLALAGTVVGVLGYAIGTSIGLGLSGLLLD